MKSFNHLSRRCLVLALTLAMGAPVDGQVPADEQTPAASLRYSADQPRPTPLTRPEMKQYLEDMKSRHPQIPLPELTDEDREQLGDRADRYESRLRHHYLNGSGQSWRGQRRSRSTATSTTGAPREPEPEMSLERDFKVELFWIVSRANNCQYCLGHQESKLLGEGLSEDRIAALDVDWSEFTEAEQAAYAFARKYTLQPHLLGDDDITALRRFYSESQILEMMLSMAWNNSINRWKEGVRVPQSPDEGGYSRLFRSADQAVDPSLPHGSYLTPTSPKYANKISQVAPIVYSSTSNEPLRKTVSQRPELESRAQVEQALEQARNRQPRLTLVSEEMTRQRLALGADDAVANWMRLLANFPTDGVNRALAVIESESNDDLTPLLKAQLSWIVARQDRAWYALGGARQRLQNLGQTPDQIESLDGDWSEYPPRQQTLFRLAKHLGASPVVLTDDEVDDAIQAAGPAELVQAVNYVTQRAAFNRITEAAGLPLDTQM